MATGCSKMDQAQANNKSDLKETSRPASEARPSEAKKTENQTDESAQDSKLKKKFASFKNWASGLRWIPTSAEELQASEEKILSYLKGKHKGYFVDIGEPKEDGCAEKGEASKAKPENLKIWTLEMESTESTKLPLVLVHGFNLASALWVLNLDQLAEKRKVYAIDLLGFGRSSRPRFRKKENPEMDLVDAIESWRKGVGLQKFDLLGHSFGGYVAAAYAIKHPGYLNRLILLEPYGFSDKTDLMEKVPFWYKYSFKLMHMAKINPMAPMRVSGPLGKLLISNQDELKKKFEPMLGAEAREITNYLYHCNALKASGELIFKQLCTSELNVKRPIILRASEFDPQIKLSIIYGQLSWIHKESEENLKKRFPANQLDHKIIAEAGHHVYSDKPSELNSYINSL